VARIGLRKTARLLRTRTGRLEFHRRHGHRLWPLTSRLARLNRRTFGRRVRVVAVVGSVGKTTTVRTAAAASHASTYSLAVYNANGQAGITDVVMGLRPWNGRTVLEAGISEPGVMAVYADIVRPDVVVVTAIASDHWKSLRTLEVTRHEKAMMVRALTGQGTAVLNADDPNVRWMASQTNARVVLYGFSPDADVRASDVRLEWPPATHFTLHVDGQRHAVRLRLVGRHMVLAALAGLAVARCEGQPLGAAIGALGELAATPERLEPVALPMGAYALLDTYKASIDTFPVAFETLARIPARRRVCVLGEMDEPPPKEHVTYRELGASAAAVADRAVFVGTKFRRYRPGAVSAGLEANAVMKAADATEAAALLRDYLEPGDLVLIKGRWQQGLARVAHSLAGRDVRCRALPCPFKRTFCAECDFLEKPFDGRRVTRLQRRGRYPVEAG
jgi:UDP-N-acetylmuramoyl-tripeptide--D-alanyl-D-alanine ligase